MPTNQRLFRDDDNSKWFVRYGDGSKGIRTFPGTGGSPVTTTLGATDFAYYSRLTGTGGATTASTPDLADGTYNLPCKIIQTQGTGSQNNPNKELNYLISVSGGVATFKYDLMLTYNAGAQIVTAAPYTTIAIPNGATIQPPAWDGNKGGELFLIAAVSISVKNGSTVNLKGLGFRGGLGGGAGGGCDGGYGENEITNPYPADTRGSGDVSPQAPVGMGGGGGGGNTGGSGGNHGGGSGGGNDTSGNVSEPNSNPIGGASGNNPSLTIASFGGAGGGGGSSPGNNPAHGGFGGNSSGNFHFISPTITVESSAVIDIDGSQGQDYQNSDNSGGGGGGSASNGLFQGILISLLGTITGLGGIGGINASGVGSGRTGSGSNGRFHIDIPTLTNLSGTTNPTYDVSTQQILQNLSGASAIAVM